MVHEGAVVAAGQRDLLVAELQLQAAVEEAEQDVVGQTGGAAVAVLSVLWMKTTMFPCHQSCREGHSVAEERSTVEHLC